MQAIADELAAYNPLIPDGCNLKATMMSEYPKVEERRKELARLGGIEHRVWVGVGESSPVFAIANEDMDRTTDDKTSAVHFLRFQLTAGQVQSARAGSKVSMGISHPECQCSVQVADEVMGMLIEDFSP